MDGSRKKCADCGDTKPLDEFYRYARSKDGRQAYCKSCHAHKSNHWHKRHPECRSQPAAHREAVKKNTQKYPFKARAKSKVQAALRRGDLVRQACERCGNPKSQAHHSDYSKPLEVVWLCSVCHGKEHRKYDKPELRQAI